MAWQPLDPNDFPQYKENQNIFNFIKESVVEKNESWDFFIAQQRGLGKSTIAIALARMIDPNFSVKNISFKAADFAEKMTSGLKKGTVLIFDDMGTAQGGSSRKWQASGVHELADIMQLNRTDGIITIGTSIELERSEKRLRSGFRCLISPVEKLSHNQTKNGLAIDIEMRVKSLDVFNDVALFKLWRYSNGGRVKLIRLYHPDVQLWHEYQVMRSEYLMNLKK